MATTAEQDIAIEEHARTLTILDIKKQAVAAKKSGDVQKAVELLRQAKVYESVQSTIDETDESQSITRLPQYWKKLAVLHKQEGDLEQAKQALLMAKEVEAKREEEQHAEMIQQQEAETGEDADDEDALMRDFEKEHGDKNDDDDDIDMEEMANNISFTVEEMLDEDMMTEFKLGGMPVPSQDDYKAKILAYKKAALQCKQQGDIPKATQNLRNAKQLEKVQKALLHMDEGLGLRINQDRDGWMETLNAEESELLGELLQTAEGADGGTEFHDSQHQKLGAEELEAMEAAEMLEFAQVMGRDALPTPEQLQEEALQHQKEALEFKAAGNIPMAKVSLLESKKCKAQAQRVAAVLKRLDAGENEDDGKKEFTDQDLEALVQGETKKEAPPEKAKPRPQAAKPQPKQPIPSEKPSDSMSSKPVAESKAAKTPPVKKNVEKPKIPPPTTEQQPRTQATSKSSKPDSKPASIPLVNDRTVGSPVEPTVKASIPETNPPLASYDSNLTPLLELARRVPKTELHLHLDGSLSPEFIWKRAKARGIVLEWDKDYDPGENGSRVLTDPSQIRPMIQRRKQIQINNGNVQPPGKNWGIFDFCNQFLQTVEEIQEATLDLARRLVREHNVQVMEIRFCPSLHTEEGLTEHQVVEAVLAGLREAKNEAPQQLLHAGAVLCALRSFPKDHCVRMAELAHEFHSNSTDAVAVCGFDIAGDEGSFPLKTGSPCMAGLLRARELGMPITVHAGEWPVNEKFGRASLDNLKVILTEVNKSSTSVKRIGHAIQMYKDNDLMTRCRNEKVVIECCLTANVGTFKQVPSFAHHPIRRMIKSGIGVTLNCDNLLLSGTLENEASPTNEVIHFVRDVMMADLPSENETGCSMKEALDHLRNALHYGSDAAFDAKRDTSSSWRQEYKRRVDSIIAVASATTEFGKKENTMNHSLTGTQSGAVVVVAKCPTPGKSKTRLIPLLGEEGATQIAEAMLCDVIATLSTHPQLKNVQLILTFAPQSGETIMRGILDAMDFSSKWKIFPMVDGGQLSSSDLGQKLTDSLLRARALIQSKGPVIFLGMDAPELPLDEIASAISHPDQALLCPAADGGYGMLSVPSYVDSEKVFLPLSAGKRWSSSLTAVAQIKALTDANVPVRLGRLMHDMDEPKDIQELCRRLQSESEGKSKVKSDDCLLKPSGAKTVQTAGCQYTRIALERLGMMTKAPTKQRSDSTTKDGPVWDPVAQIYVGGQVPENAEVKDMIRRNGGFLRVFGYGSLCWKPGGILADPRVTSALGKAMGYRRCWAQKSTDHRGEPRFPGIVCTLLTEAEVQSIRGDKDNVAGTANKGMTEGVLYVVPPELVEECLEELDFREKGGYARDVIDVVEDKTGKGVQALLYRGTPDNPALWPRALRDLPFAAAVLSVATGPSGKNDVYLNQLNAFLEKSTDISALKGFDDTIDLANMVKTYQSVARLFFLYGAGSNQHNQLLLDRPNNAASLANGGEDAHDLKESVLCVANEGPDDLPKAFLAGGGHSGLLTSSGRLYLFGWNERGQTGSESPVLSKAPMPMISPIKQLVEKCSMGHNHTLYIEKGTGRLWALGDNSKGQVDGNMSRDSVTVPTTPSFLQKLSFRDISCGLFHSAAITNEGEVVAYGDGRFGQCLSDKASPVSAGKWKPGDGKRLVNVACGRQHTIVVDEVGRVYSFGDNKYGQLGRETNSDNNRDHQPKQVRGPWESAGFVVREVRCGWSHSVVLATKRSGEDGVVQTKVYGWGRNDRGQLGLGDDPSIKNVADPRILFENHANPIQQIDCGSEFTIISDSNDNVYGCGWNEHGNLAQSHVRDVYQLTKVAEALAISNPPSNQADARVSVAAGGGHIIIGRIPRISQPVLAANQAAPLGANEQEKCEKLVKGIAKRLEVCRAQTRQWQFLAWFGEAEQSTVAREQHALWTHFGQQCEQAIQYLQNKGFGSVRISPYQLKDKSGKTRPPLRLLQETEDKDEAIVSMMEQSMNASPPQNEGDATLEVAVLGLLHMDQNEKLLGLMKKQQAKEPSKKPACPDLRIEAKLHLPLEPVASAAPAPAAEDPKAQSAAHLVFYPTSSAMKPSSDSKAESMLYSFDARSQYSHHLLRFPTGDSKAAKTVLKRIETKTIQLSVYYTTQPTPTGSLGSDKGNKSSISSWLFGGKSPEPIPPPPQDNDHSNNVLLGKISVELRSLIKRNGIVGDFPLQLSSHADNKPVGGTIRLGLCLRPSPLDPKRYEGNKESAPLSTSSVYQEGLLFDFPAPQ